MSCAISGELPEEPVVSIKTGHVFEKRLILKALKDSGNVCPVTKKDLHPEDLIPLMTNPVTKPRPPAAMSLPGMIGLFQSEWDSLMLETYTLKSHLHTVRQELAHALYQNDAAKRVIARLVKERNEARALLEQTKANVKEGVQQAAEEEEAEGSELSAETIATLKEFSKTATKGRKKRVKALQAQVVSDENIQGYKTTSSYPLHSSTKAGITALDVHSSEQSLVLTGGNDGHVILFNRKSGKIVDTLKNHKKPVTSVKFHLTEQLIVSTSEDSTGIIWGPNSEAKGKFAPRSMLTAHSGPVTDAVFHPTGKYLFTSSLDRTWAFYDVSTGTCKKQVSDQQIKGGFTRIRCHPDGLLVGLGTEDNLLRIFATDQKQKNLINFRHAAQVTGLSFSENGYYLASADIKGTVKLWDLRKVTDFQTIEDKNIKSIKDISFDPSGSYLGIAATGGAVHVYNTKQWKLVKTFEDHRKDATAVTFGNQMSFVASTSLDRNLKFYS